MYKKLSEIAVHNWTADRNEVLDQLIALITSERPLNDDIRLNIINTALDDFGGTVIEALIAVIYHHRYTN